MSRSWPLRPTPTALADRYRSEQLWTDETLGELLNAHLTSRGERALRVWSDSRPVASTVGEVFARARRFAGAMAQRGLGPGDVIAFQLPNCAEAAVVFWGAALLGAVIVPIVHFYGTSEVSYILRDAGPRVLITADQFGHLDFLDNLADLDSLGGLGDLELVAVVPFTEPLQPVPAQIGSAIVVGFTDLLETAHELDHPIHTDPDQAALVAYTSGTTANPKGVIHTHRSIVAEIRQLSAIQPPDPRPLLTGAPVGHAIGMLTGLLLPVYRNQAIHLIDRWDPAAVLAAMVEGDLTAGSGATFFLLSLLDAPDLGPQHLGRMRYVGLGGSSVPEPIADRAIDLGISVARSYGSTEHPSTTGAPHHLPQEKRKRTDGRPLPGVELRIVDPSTGNDAGAGSPGEIWSRGPDLFAGYTDPALTADAFTADGWYRTGDIGVLDDDGWLTITDRLKDIIIRGGENISAAEVEQAMLTLPEVAEVAVVAAPDARLGEHACAFVRLGSGAESLTLERVQSHLAGLGLARPKWPEELKIVTDLPRTPSGKVKKFQLRAELRTGHR